MASNKNLYNEVIYLNVVNEMIAYIESFLKKPVNRIAQLRNSIIQDYDGNWHNKTIKELAIRARKSLGIISTNKKLLMAIETSGIHALEKNRGTKRDAYSVWSNDETPIIVLNGYKVEVHQNFDLAY